jgi:hypothetical protein
MNSILQHLRRPDISFRRDGLIQISTRLTQLLSLQKGCGINITMHNGEYYIFALYRTPMEPRSHVATCFPSKRGGNHFRVHSSKLCAAMLNAVNAPSRASFFVGGAEQINGKTFVPIITRNPLSIS